MKRQIEKDCIIVPLPSKGECYPHKKGEVPIAYMTAMDENILADKKLNDEWKAIDTLLEKKILDKDFKVDELYVDDRNAILLYIIKVNYGNKHTNPMNGIEIDLDTIGYSEGKLKGDENGWFDYDREGQPLIKFRADTRSDEIETYKLLDDVNSENVTSSLRLAERCLLKNITMSIGGITDKMYIDKYIERLQYDEIATYISFISDNTPKIDADVNFMALLFSKINL